MDTKSLFLSKTFWANIISFGAVMLGAQHVAVSPDDQASLVAGVMTVVNIVLRLVTKQPVHIVGGGQ